MSLKLDFDERELRELIETLDLDSSFTRSVNKKISFLIENDIKDIITRRKVDSSGTRWKKWKNESYRRRQEKRGRRERQNILLDKGTLRSSISSDFDSDELNVGSNLEYASRLNDSREFLYIAESLDEDIYSIIENEMAVNFS